MKAGERSRGIAPLVFNLSTTWKWVVSFMPISFTTGKKLVPAEEDTMGPTADLHILDKESLVPTKPSLHCNGNILYVSPELKR